MDIEEARKITDAALSSYLESFRQDMPELFEDPRILISVKAVIRDVTDIIISSTRAHTTNNIGKNVLTFAKYDIDDIAKRGWSPEVEAEIKANPIDAILRVVAGTWDTALNLIDTVGHSGLDIEKEMAAYDRPNPTKNTTDNDIDYKFTSKEVGKA